MGPDVKEGDWVVVVQAAFWNRELGLEGGVYQVTELDVNKVRVRYGHTRARLAAWVDAWRHLLPEELAARQLAQCHHL
jgi:hypothetical protein